MLSSVDIDIAEKIAQEIELRGLTISNARRKHKTMNLLDYEIDEILLAVYRSCAAVARQYVRSES